MDEPDRVYRERGLRDAVLAGDEQAWRLWYEQCHGPVYAYVLWRFGGLRNDADEVAQDVWLTAIRRLEAFDPAAGSFTGWLRGIAAGLIRNRIRREGSRHRATRPDRDREEGPADAELLRQEQARLVARTLASLPEHYEAILRAKYLDGLSVADIAAGRGESPKATESLLTRAREAFRAAYEILE